MKSNNNLLENLFDFKGPRPSFSFTYTMAATHSCIRTSKMKDSLRNIPEKTNASCKGTVYYLLKFPRMWLQFGKWPSMFLPYVGQFVLEVCVALWALQLITTWVNGRDTFQRACEPSLHPLDVLRPLLSGFLFLSIAEEAGLWEWRLDCLWMYSKISYTCWGLISTSDRGNWFLVRGPFALKYKADFGPLDFQPSHRVLVYLAYVNKDAIIIGLYSAMK